MSADTPVRPRGLVFRLPSRAMGPEDDLCASCRFAAAVRFARFSREDLACSKGIFTLMERRVSGPVTSCGAFEAKNDPRK